jgi:hypothetical protein
MQRTRKSLVGGLAVAAMVAVSSVASVPAASAYPSIRNAPVELVAQKNRGKNWRNNDNWRNNWRHGHRHGNGSGWVAPLGLFGAGVIVGTIINNGPPVRSTYYRYGYKGYPSRNAYCHARYRSYNSYTGLYLGYDGQYHRCR